MAREPHVQPLEPLLQVGVGHGVAEGKVENVAVRSDAVLELEAKLAVLDLRAGAAGARISGATDAGGQRQPPLTPCSVGNATRCHLGRDGTARVTGRMSWAYKPVCLFMLAMVKVRTSSAAAP